MKIKSFKKKTDAFLKVPLLCKYNELSKVTHIL